MKSYIACAVAALVLFGSIVIAQQAPQTQPAARRGGRGGAASQPSITPTAQELQQIKAKLDQLNAAVLDLRKAKIDEDLIADVEVPAHYVALTLRFPEEFFNQGVVTRCSSVLDDGLRRAQLLKDGKPDWLDAKGRVMRAFRSKLDGTPQPYRMLVPESYDKSKPTPLYVYLHGRGDTDLGLGWVGSAPGTGGGRNINGPSYLQVQIFGRANNNFRWLGEADVMEAIESVRKRYNVDPDRILMAGFSMGGIASWQIGLRRPDMFCGLEIDAGVPGTRLSMDGLNPSQRGAATPYGVVMDHSINSIVTPMVAYAGENDAQLASSVMAREQLVKAGYTIEQTGQYSWKGKDVSSMFLVIPGAGHSHATGATAQAVDAFNAENLKRGRIVPDHIKFVTYSTRFNQSFWITVDGLQKHYDRAFIDAQRDTAKSNYTIKTTNVSRLILTDVSAAKKISIDNDSLDVKPASTLLLVHADGHWKIGDPAAPTGLRKQRNLQGPINDVFLDSFMCVTGSGTAWNAAAEARNKQELTRFERQVAKDYRGAARIKADNAVTADDIANCNLILFGDPGSNAMLAKIADKLPIKWTRDSIVVGDKTYNASEHLPVLIYPNPLNPQRYVVLNTGLTAAGGQGQTAGGYGDWAVLKSGGEVVDGGVFNESWKLEQ